MVTLLCIGAVGFTAWLDGFAVVGLVVDADALGEHSHIIDVSRAS
jgi:hypothetical protein